MAARGRTAAAGGCGVTTASDGALASESSAKSVVPPFADSSPADNSDSSLRSSNPPFADTPHTSPAEAASTAPAAESSLKNAESSLQSAESAVCNPDADQCSVPPFAESPGATTGSPLADSSIAATDAPPAPPPHESSANDPSPAFSLDEATGADTPPPPHAHEVPANDTQPPLSLNEQSDAVSVSTDSLTTAANAASSAESSSAHSSSGTTANDAPSAAAGSSRYAADAPHATYVRSAESPRAATDESPASPPHENTAAAIDVLTAAAALRLLVPLLSFVALAMLAVKLTGMRFILFPPLVVILYEMLSHREHCPWVGRPIAIPVACFASATGGYLFFAHLPFAPLVAMLSMAWGIAVLRTLNLHMPPVLAVALLPLVMTNPTIGYPIAVGLGTMLASAWFEFLARWHWIAPLPSAPPLQ